MLVCVDALAAIRSDLTFLMVGRAWLWANYLDFDQDVADDGGSFRTRPLFSAFLLLSPRKKRFLANLSSNADFALGEQGKPMAWLRPILKGSNFSATLLVEPGLVHYELGWPNQLRWEGNFDVLKVSICGGMIVRASEHEFVIGQSFLARGSLAFAAGIDLGFIGARLSATADVAYGARYIGVASFDDPVGQSAFYGAIGIEIHVAVSVEFWIEIDLFIGSITLHFGFSFAVNFTASVELGILLSGPPGIRGTATLGVCVMGHDLHFAIKIAANESAVDKAKQLTEKFLSVGLESGDVEPVPGTASLAGPQPIQPQLLAALAPTHLPHAEALAPVATHRPPRQPPRPNWLRGRRNTHRASLQPSGVLRAGPSGRRSDAVVVLSADAIGSETRWDEGIWILAAAAV